MPDSNNPVTALNGEVQFVQHHLPPLEAGAYQLQVQQTITADTPHGKVDETFTNTRKFAVRGERYTILPSEINSVFPPDKSQGEFFNTLPHIVLNRSTLPWERSTTTAAPVYGNSNTDVPSFLGLLLFDAFDPVPTIQQGTLLDLVNSVKHQGGTLPDGYVSYPGAAYLDYGETFNDKCSMIDIPVALFNEIAPSVADLKWLAHVRKVSPDRKPTGASKPTPSSQLSYANIIGNRLPLMGRKNTVHLVSFEGMQPYLPSSDGTPSTQFPEGTTHVRLASLHNWAFDTVKEGEGFTEYLEQLSIDALHMPDSSAATSANDANDQVSKALAMGYVPIRHELRDGGNTVSWYRSPLTPYPVPRHLEVPIASADAATRFNPNSGMFDVSYATAWETGRLLALQNKGFATMLFDWKRAQQQQAVNQLEIGLLEKILDTLTENNA